MNLKEILEGLAAKAVEEERNRPVEMIQKAVLTLLVAKAKTEDMCNLMDTAWHNVGYGEDADWRRGTLAHWASRNGLLHILPDGAHEVLHREGIQHSHDGMENDKDGNHAHEIAKEPVKKGFSPNGLITKAWTLDDGTVVCEGWVSTPDADLEKDITLPEAFLDAADGYAARGMPLTSEHNTDKYPVGHGQRIAVVKAGQILKTVTHPTDAADAFEHFPGVGDGVYGRFAITEPQAAGAVRKGNVRSFSYIALPVETEPLPTGGRILKKHEPWLESTIAAFPVNSKAVMTAAH